MVWICFAVYIVLLHSNFNLFCVYDICGHAPSTSQHLPPIATPAGDHHHHPATATVTSLFRHFQTQFIITKVLGWFCCKLRMPRQERWSPQAARQHHTGPPTPTQPTTPLYHRSVITPSCHIFNTGLHACLLITIWIIQKKILLAETFPPYPHMVWW